MRTCSLGESPWLPGASRAFAAVEPVLFDVSYAVLSAPNVWVTNCVSMYSRTS